MVLKIIIILFLLFLWGFFIEPNLIIIKKYKVNIPDLSPEIKRIIFASDFHIGRFQKYRLKHIVNTINKQNPDIVLFGGDFIKGHSGEHTLEIETQAKEYAKIKAPVISVLGNHDGWFDKYRVKKALEKNGITVLSNTSIQYKNLCLAGLEDLQTGIPNVQSALTETEKPRILISHTPDIYYDVKEDVDLILAGHVHGGQVRIPFYGSILVPSKFGNKFACGYFKETKNKMIVSKGLGTSILGVRFNAVPEIVVIDVV